MPTIEQGATSPTSDKDTIAVRFTVTSRQIESGIANPSLLDEHLMYGEQFFRDILQQAQNLDEELQWKLKLRFEEAIAGFTFDQLVEAHVERISKARNGSYHNEKAEYCSVNATSYIELSNDYARVGERRKAKDMRKLAKGWSKMAAACLRMPE